MGRRLSTVATQAELDAARFALRAADALSATLNLRRTVRCAVGLATERFGSWAGISLFAGDVLRRIDSEGVDDFSTAAPRRGRRVDDFTAAVLGDASTRVLVRTPPVDVAFWAALGVPERHRDRPGTALVSLPLPAGTAGRAVLSVLGPAEPSLAELEDFVGRVARAVTAAGVYEERATLAATLRDALVPAELPAPPGIELGASYRPAQAATQIGGDFYDVVPLDGDRWALSIGDVCGKGVDAAVLTGRVRQSLRTAGLVSDDPVRVLTVLNETLLRLDGETYVTAAYCILEPSSDGIRVRCALGGHPPPLLVRGGGVATLTAKGTLIGMLDEVRFDTVEFDLARGDMLLLYTDGAPEARGPAGLMEMLPLARTLADCEGMSAQAVTERLMQVVTEHLAGWPHDDIALVAVRALGTAR